MHGIRREELLLLLWRDLGSNLDAEHASGAIKGLSGGLSMSERTLFPHWVGIRAKDVGVVLEMACDDPMDACKDQCSCRHRRSDDDTSSASTQSRHLLNSPCSCPFLFSFSTTRLARTILSFHPASHSIQSTNSPNGVDDVLH